MIYILHLVSYLWLLKKTLNKESIIDTVLVVSMLLPDIGYIEATNFILVILLLYIGIYIQNRKLLVNKEVIAYWLSMFLVVLVTTISWLISGGNAPSNAGAALFGIIRYPTIIFLLAIYENTITNCNYKRVEKIYHAIMIISIVNVIACIFQKINKGYALQVFSSLYSYSQSHINELTRASKYYRAYGTWESPMSLGIYSLIALSILVLNKEIRNKKTWLLNISLCVIIGMMSLTKSFFLGMVIFIVCTYVMSYFEFFKKKHFSAISLTAYTAGVIAIPIMFLLFSKAYDWSQKAWPHLHYYLGFIINPQNVLASRLSQTGSLNETLEMIKNHFLIGVGPISVRGELVGDNEFVVLLHGGGIAVLIIAIGILFSWIMKCIVQQDIRTVIILLIWILSGFSLPVLFHYKICLLPICYYLILKSEIGVNEHVQAKDLYDETIVKSIYGEKCNGSSMKNQML